MFYFVIIPQKPVCFLTRDQEQSESGWKGRYGGTGRSGDKGNDNQNYVREKLFSIKERKNEKK